MEPAQLQPRVRSQLYDCWRVYAQSPEARKAGSSEQLCYLWLLCVGLESFSCLESLFLCAALLGLNVFWVFLIFTFKANWIMLPFTLGPECVAFL